MTGDNTAHQATHQDVYELDCPANLLIAGEYAVTRPGGIGLAIAVSPRARAVVTIGRERPASADGGSAGTYRGSVGSDGGRAGGGSAGTNRGSVGSDGGRAGGGSAESAGGGSIGTNRGTDETNRRPVIAGDAGPANITVTARMGTRTVNWPADPLPIAPAALRVFELNHLPVPQGSHIDIVIDTGPFFEDAQRKTGLGSSAASAVLLVAGLILATGKDPAEEKELVAGLAHQAHRTSKGNRGSGYDVYTSTFGGVGRFAAGVTPEWKALDQKLPADTEFFAWVNEEPVDTSRAVSSFEYICLEDPDWMRDVTERSNHVVEDMCRAVNNGHRREFFRTVNEARAIGHEIGERIAVPATVSTVDAAYLDQSGTKWTYKACGAGNERAVVFVAISDSGSEAGSSAAIGNICETEYLSETGLHLRALQIAPEGLTCRPTLPSPRGASWQQ